MRLMRGSADGIRELSARALKQWSALNLKVEHSRFTLRLKRKYLQMSTQAALRDTHKGSLSRKAAFNFSEPGL